MLTEFIRLPFSNKSFVRYLECVGASFLCISCDELTCLPVHQAYAHTHSQLYLHEGELIAPLK